VTNFKLKFNTHHIHTQANPTTNRNSEDSRWRRQADDGKCVPVPSTRRTNECPDEGSRRRMRINDYIRDALLRSSVGILFVFGLEHSSCRVCLIPFTNNNGHKTSPRIRFKRTFLPPLPIRRMVTILVLFPLQQRGLKHIVLSATVIHDGAKARHLPSIVGHAGNRLIETVIPLKAQRSPNCARIIKMSFHRELASSASEVRDILSRWKETTRRFYDCAVRGYHREGTWRP
jgi:hypothetical protein